MTAKEMIIKLGECDVIHVSMNKKTNIAYVQDYGSYVGDYEPYVGNAYVTFDENGNCVKVEEA